VRGARNPITANAQDDCRNSQPHMTALDRQQNCSSLFNKAQPGVTAALGFVPSGFA